MTVPLCIDCRHVVWARADGIRAHYCAREARERIDPVSGEKSRIGYLRCDRERRETDTRSYCGPEGSLFEPRQAEPRGTSWASRLLRALRWPGWR